MQQTNKIAKRAKAPSLLGNISEREVTLHKYLPGTLTNHHSLGCRGSIIRYLVSLDGGDDTRNIFLEKRHDGVPYESLFNAWMQKTETLR